MRRGLGRLRSDPDSALGRRTFLALVGGVAGGWLCHPGSLAAARLPTPGVQLYTVRDLLQADFEGTLTRLAAIGFRQVEFASYHGRRPQAVRTALDAAGLAAPSAHVPIETARADWTQALDAARVIGHSYLVIAWIPEHARRTLDDYRKVADLLNEVGQRSLAAGIRLAYHNHDFEFAKIEGRMPYDLLLERCSPSAVAFEMDLYWITKGGQDPLAYFERWPGRFPMVHVKDSSGPPDYRMADVGAGVIPWRAIFARREQAGIRYYFIEHDQPRDPLASVRASLEYLRSLDV